jgi:hypothetical protein
LDVVKRAAIGGTCWKHGCEWYDWPVCCLGILRDGEGKEGEEEECRGGMHFGDVEWMDGLLGELS